MLASSDLELQHIFSYSRVLLKSQGTTNKPESTQGNWKHDAVIIFHDATDVTLLLTDRPWIQGKMWKHLKFAWRGVGPSADAAYHGLVLSALQHRLSCALHKAPLYSLFSFSSILMIICLISQATETCLSSLVLTMHS